MIFGWGGGGGGGGGGELMKEVAFILCFCFFFLRKSFCVIQRRAGSYFFFFIYKYTNMPLISTHIIKPIVTVSQLQPHFCNAQLIAREIEILFQFC